MSSYSYQYPAPLWTGNDVRAEFKPVRLGMMIGGMAAFAENLHAFRSGQKSQPQAIQDALRTTVYAGASVAVADYVYRQMGRSDWLGTLAAVSAGSAMMYFMVRADDRMREKAKERAEKQAEKQDQRQDES